jgi:hypothetical protein
MTTKRKTHKAFYVLLFLILTTFNTKGQAVVNLNDNNGTMIELGFEYGTYLPQRDLDAYFGRHAGTGGHFQVLTKKNLYLGGQMQFIFGNQVSVDVTQVWKDPIDNVYGLNYTFADILTKQRGLSGHLYIGKLFPIKSKRARMGIKATLGVGFLQHKLHIQEDPESFMPQMEKRYKALLDHKTNGISLQQFIGFHYLANDRMANWYVGFDFIEAFTRNRRSYNYNLDIPTDINRLDIATGFKIGWILPFYINESSENVWF